MYYTIYPNRIQSQYRDYDRVQHLGGVFYLDTTFQFNTYKLIISDGQAKLYINGDLVLNQPAGIGHWNPFGIDVVEFGAASSQATAEAYFDEVRAYTLTPETILSISTDKTSYNLNEVVHVTLEINRAEEEAKEMILELELKEPCDVTDMLFNSQLFLMPAEFKNEVTFPIKIDKSLWISGGEYSLIATLRDSSTGNVIDRDTADFEINDEVTWKESWINKLKKFLP
jgi:hypothetical protein